MKIVKLEFYNPDATPPITRLAVSEESVEPIMRWYGSHYLGDNYKVLCDGEDVPMDQDGEKIC